MRNVSLRKKTEFVLFFVNLTLQIKISLKEISTFSNQQKCNKSGSNNFVRKIYHFVEKTLVSTQKLSSLNIFFAKQFFILKQTYFTILPIFPVSAYQEKVRITNHNNDNNDNLVCKR